MIGTIVTVTLEITNISSSSNKMHKKKPTNKLKNLVDKY
jgi:hypothetical protein